MNKFALSAAIVMLLAGPVFALPAQPPVSAEGWAQAVAPFVDDMTFAVVRINIDKIDPAEVTQYIVDRMRKSGATEPELLEAPNGPRDWALALKQAGLHDVYVVFSMADMPVPVFVVAPLYEGANAQHIASLLTSDPEHSPDVSRLKPASQPSTQTPMRPGAAVFDSYVFVGRASTLQRIQAMPQPAARPDLVQAFAATGDSAVQAALVPSDDFRRVIEETMPALPAELGGQPSTVLTKGVQWAGAGLNVPPNLSAQLVIQSADEASAQALSDLVNKALSMMTTHPDPATSRPTHLEKEVMEVRQLVPTLDEVMAMLQPKLTGDRLVLTLTNEDATKLVEQLFTPLVIEGRRKAKQAISLAQCRLLATALFMYQEENHGRWPDDLHDLLPAGLIGESTLINPSNPRLKPGYVYVKPSLPSSRISEPHMKILVYENFTDWPAAGICAGFLDSHSERIADREWFEKLLADSKAAAATQPATNK